jgi:hypothetical protein
LFTLKRDWRCCARDLLDAALKLVCYYNLLDDQTYSNLKRFAAMMEACCHVKELVLCLFISAGIADCYN